MTGHHHESRPCYVLRGGGTSAKSLQAMKKLVFSDACLDLGWLPVRSSSAGRGNTLFWSVLQQWNVQWTGSAVQGELRTAIVEGIHVKWVSVGYQYRFPAMFSKASMRIITACPHPHGPETYSGPTDG